MDCSDSIYLGGASCILTSSLVQLFSFGEAAPTQAQMHCAGTECQQGISCRIHCIQKKTLRAGCGHHDEDVCLEIDIHWLPSVVHKLVQCVICQEALCIVEHVRVARRRLPKILRAQYNHAETLGPATQRTL